MWLARAGVSIQLQVHKDRQYEHPKIVSKVVANALTFELQPKQQQQMNSHHQG